MIKTAINMKKPKILTWDLEFRGTENYKGELKIYPGYLLCFACKRLGKQGVKVLSRRDYKGMNVLDDEGLVRAIAKELRDVDLHIYQYGGKIDFKFMQTKLMQYGLEPLPDPPVAIDTCTLARQKLALVSNSMRTQAEFFKLTEKKKITHEQWYKAFALDEETMKLVEDRCASDVRLTEKLYLKLRKLIHNYPSIREEGCNACGNLTFESRGIRATNKRRYRRLFCKRCGVSKLEPIKT